jgi:hypothetical protein
MRKEGSQKRCRMKLSQTVFGDTAAGTNCFPISQLGVDCAVSKDCVRTHVTVHGEMLAKVIDEHDVAVHIADE